MNTDKHVYNAIRCLTGPSLSKRHAQAQAMGGLLTVDEPARTSAAVHNLTGHSRRIAIREIQEIVARAFHLTRAELVSRSRHQHITCARHIAMYLSRELAGRNAGAAGVSKDLRPGRCASFPRIGIAFSRDHSSVMYACNSVERRRDVDAAFARLLDRLARNVRGEGPTQEPLEAA